MCTRFASVKAVLLSAVLIFVAASHLQATEWVTFAGGGYGVDILVGQEREALRRSGAFLAIRR